MIICPDCKERLDPEWKCRQCGWTGALDGRIRRAMPGGVDAVPGFAAEFFGDLDAVEGEHFWFAARNALIAWALAKYFPDARTFLEVGCGTGQVAAALAHVCPQLRITASEAFLEGLRIAAGKAPAAALMQADARRLPYDSEFDVVGAFDVLEHVPEHADALASIVRAARPAGGVILTVPQHQWLWSPLDDYTGHQRRYSREDLVSLVRASGLRVLRVTSFVSLLLPAMLASRALQRGKPVDPAAEFRASARVNRLGTAVMALERRMIRSGMSFPAGGSLLMVAKR